MPAEIIFSESERLNIISMYEDSFPLKEIANKYKISVNLLIRKLKKWNITLIGNKQKFSQKEKLDIIELYKSKVPLSEICEKFSTSPETIRKICIKNNIQSRRKKHLQNVEKHKSIVIERYIAGESCWTIGPDYDISAQCLYNYLRKWSVDIDVSRNSVCKKLEPYWEKIKFLYFSEKRTLKEIAYIYDTWPSTIRDLILKNGLKARNNNGILQSGLERAFKEQFLKELNFNEQYKIENRYYDFYIPSHDLLIEVDGDYWHGNPLFYKDYELNEFQRKSRERDFVKDNLAKEHGKNLVRFWENDILFYPDKIINRLNQLLQ